MSRAGATPRYAPGIRRRLGIGLAVGVLVMWLLATLVAGLVVRDELDEAFDDALAETAQRLLPLAVEDVLDRQGPPQSRTVSALVGAPEFLTYLVRDDAGHVLLKSRDADPALFTGGPATGFRDTEQHRIFGESAVSGTILLEIAEPLQHRREAALEATAALLSPLPVLIPLSLLGVWWIVRRGLRPVVALRGRIETRGGGDLTPLALDGLPREIGPIAESVNRLMERIRAALEAERSFTANSAHELRTPIAGALAQTQRLITEAPDAEAAEHARRVEASLRHLMRLSEKLMQLARAESGSCRTAEAQDLGPVLALVLDEFRREGGGAPALEFQVESGDPLLAPMDADAFAILLRNLIENALKHGPEGEPVTVELAAGNRVRVINGGPPVPSERLARLTARFERGPTDAPGSGLGLAIAETIVRDAGARLDLLSPAQGREDGFEAVVILPEV